MTTLRRGDRVRIGEHCSSEQRELTARLDGVVWNVLPDGWVDVAWSGGYLPSTRTHRASSLRRIAE